MARRLILDTGILIAAERGANPLASVVVPDDDLVIAAVTVAALFTGVELATDQHRSRRATFVERVLSVIPVEAYDLATTRAHGRLLAHVRRTGTPRGAHDLIIAATAATTDRTILTTDGLARFGDLPGVDCQVV